MSKPEHKKAMLVDWIEDGGIGRQGRNLLPKIHENDWKTAEKTTYS